MEFFDENRLRVLVVDGLSSTAIELVAALKHCELLSLNYGPALIRVSLSCELALINCEEWRPHAIILEPHTLYDRRDFAAIRAIRDAAPNAALVVYTAHCCADSALKLARSYDVDAVVCRADGPAAVIAALKYNIARINYEREARTRGARRPGLDFLNLKLAAVAQ